MQPDSPRTTEWPDDLSEEFRKGVAFAGAAAIVEIERLREALQYIANSAGTGLQREYLAAGHLACVCAARAALDGGISHARP